jgi:thymidylate kinase
VKEGLSGFNDRNLRHALERIRKRKVSEEGVRDALENPDEIFYDTQTGYFVVIRKRNSKWLLVI